MANPFGPRLWELARSRSGLVAVAWVLSLAVAGLLYLWTPEFVGVPGVVEVVDYNVAAPETLRIIRVPVEVGSPVRKGDVLAVLDPAPLTLERDLVRAELDLRTAEVRFTQLTDERSFAQAVSGAEQTLARETVEAGRVEADLQAARKRLAWWKTQVAAGTAPGWEAQSLAVDEAALSRRLRSHKDAIATLSSQLKDGRQRLDAYRSATGRGSETTTGGEADTARASVRVAEAQLALLESRLAALTLRAPADGVIQKVAARAGDVAQAGQTVVLVREDIPKRVFAYPSASQAAMLRTGTSAWVAARDIGGSQRFPAHVVAIGPGLVPFPVALQNRTNTTSSFGQEVILRLDGPSPLAPGQVVDISLLRVDSPVQRNPSAPTSGQGLPVPTADASPATVPVTVARPPVAGDPEPIAVPPALARVTRFEPSGLTWVPEIDRYLLVSDDTGLPDRDDHAPWLFRMDRDGRVDEQPTVLQGAPEVSDLESITRTADGRLWLLASQSVSRKGKRPASRTLLLRAELREGRPVVTASASLADALANLPSDRLAGLGLSRRDAGYRGKGFDRLLDIEGLCADGNALLLGLKEPRDESGWAIVWRMDDPERLVESGRLGDGDPSMWGRVALPLGEGASIQHAGISDLAALPGGGLALLGTALPGNPLGDLGALWLIPAPLTGGDLRPVKIREFPGLKPEGVAAGPVPGEVTIVFDEGTKTQHYLRVPLPR